MDVDRLSLHSPRGRLWVEFRGRPFRDLEMARGPNVPDQRDEGLDSESNDQTERPGSGPGAPGHPKDSHPLERIVISGEYRRQRGMSNACPWCRIEWTKLLAA